MYSICADGTTASYARKSAGMFATNAIAVSPPATRNTLLSVTTTQSATPAATIARLVVDALPKGINFGACVGHGTLRSYVLGDRAYAEQGATAEEIAAMPAGTRPLRRPVHPGNKPQLEINRVSAETQRTLLSRPPYAEWAKGVLD